MLIEFSNMEVIGGLAEIIFPGKGGAPDWNGFRKSGRKQIRNYEQL